MQCTSTCKNCETDEAEFLTVDVLKDVSIDPDNPGEELVTNTEETVVDLSTSSEILNNSKIYYKKSSLESCSIVYFAGYLAKKCLDMFLCTDCDLTKNNDEYLNEPPQILILKKTFDNVGLAQGLKIPSDKLLEIVEICLDIFQNLFPKIKTEKKNIFSFKEKALPIIYKKYSDVENSTCHNHYMYIIELLFRVKLYKECKVENTNLRKRVVQNTDKLRILENK
jgi:hypothetical protein